MRPKTVEPSSASTATLHEANRPTFAVGPVALWLLRRRLYHLARDRYGCATRRQKGTCDNGRTITRQTIEERVLTGLKERLLAPDLVAEFVAAVQEELQALQARRRRDETRCSRKRAEVERRIAGMMRAIEDGLYEPAMNQRLKGELASLEAEPQSDAPVLDLLLHPSLPEL